MTELSSVDLKFGTNSAFSQKKKRLLVLSGNKEKKNPKNKKTPEREREKCDPSTSYRFKKLMAHKGTLK